MARSQTKLPGETVHHWEICKYIGNSKYQMLCPVCKKIQEKTIPQAMQASKCLSCQQASRKKSSRAKSGA